MPIPDGRGPARFIRAFSERLLAAIFPPSCALCGAATAEEDLFHLCPECKKKLVPRGPHACVRCAQSIDGELAGAGITLCGGCRLSPPPFDASAAALRYEGASREMVHRLKFNGRIRLVAPVAGLLCADLHRAGFMPAVDAILPVPLHRKRLFQRGYNQSYLLARELARAFEKPVETEWLKRSRSTAPQFSLSRAERRENIKGAFAAMAGAPIKDKALLLVDDVMTTGATLAEAAKTLKKAGAAKVFCAVAARA